MWLSRLEIGNLSTSLKWLGEIGNCNKLHGNMKMRNSVAVNVDIKVKGASGK